MGLLAFASERSVASVRVGALSACDCVWGKTAEMRAVLQNSHNSESGRIQRRARGWEEV